MSVFYLRGHRRDGYAAIGRGCWQVLPSLLPLPAASSSPTIPTLGPSPGGDLTGKHETNPRDIPATTIPPARNSGAALRLAAPALPRPGEPKFSLAPARGETLPAPALISMARRPRGSRTPSWRCSVAASQGCTCVSHKHGGASRSRCGHGTRGSVGGIPGRQRAPEQHRLKIIIFLPDLTFT